MSDEAPRIDTRRAADFERELIERARAWIPEWALQDAQGDFGVALLRVAARFDAEVTERLDRVGDKMARGFLDWLAVRGKAALPARMPVAFRLTPAADAVDVPLRTRLQAAVDDASVIFESQTALRLVPGSIDRLVAVDPENDAYFLPPPGLSSLDPVDPAPTRWSLKSFAPPGATILQVDPSQGLATDALVEAAGAQFRIVAAKGDLVTIEPAVPAGDGLAEGTVLTAVSTFVPFDATARNWQQHVVYLGDKELLNLETAAYIDVVGAEKLGNGVTWEYWGKNASNGDPDKVMWWNLPPDSSVTPEDAVTTRKPAGSVEVAKVGETESRWIRARVNNVKGSCAPITLDALSLRINRPSKTVTAADGPSVNVFVNSTPSPKSNFLPLGATPRMFDTLYVGCAEAFSKPQASVTLHFDLADTSFQAMTVIAAGPTGTTLAGVDASGSLHLFQVNPDGTLVPLFGRGPLQPRTPDGLAVKLGQDTFRPAAWVSGADFYVTVAAQADVWVWHEHGGDFVHSGWEPLATPLAGAGGVDVAGLAVMQDAGDATVVALRGKRLSRRTVQANSPWVHLPARDAGVELDIVSLASIRSESSTLAVDSVVVVAPDAGVHGVYQVSNASTSKLLDDVADDVVPAASKSATALHVAAAASNHKRLLAHEEPPSAGVTNPVHTALSDGSVLPSSLDSRIESNAFTVYGLGESSAGTPAVLSWVPFVTGVQDIVFSTDADASTGLPRGSVAVSDALVFVPGTLGQVLALSTSTQRFAGSIQSSHFIRALATDPVSPALVAGDVVACAINPAGTRFRFGVIGDGPTAYSLQHYYWIELQLGDLAADAVTKPCYIVRGSSKRTGGSKLSATTYQLDIADTTATAPGSVLMFHTAPNAFSFFVVDTVSNATPRVATLKVEAGDMVPAQPDYWVAQEIQGRIVPAVAFDASNNAWDADVLDAGALYFPPPLDPQRQRATAVTRDATPPGNRPHFVALAEAWITGPSTGSTQFIVQETVQSWRSLVGDTTSNPTLSWEYWNGTSWATLAFNTGGDTTQNLKHTGTVNFKAPTDFKPTDWSGKTDYWVRARLVGGDYGHEKVVVTAVTKGDTTTQTVDRVVDGIQAPQAVDLWVSYQLSEQTLPAYLVTEDSGTRRDQSDANRSREARIELFTPLCATLNKLYRGPGDGALGGAEECLPDCDCGTLATSTTRSTQSPRAAPPSCDSAEQPASGGPPTGRALLLGFSKPPAGEPVNVLMVVDRERYFRGAAPLTVEALIAGRFERIVASDASRAIGETGLLSMSLPVPPSTAELFGRSLAWMALTPNANLAVPWAPAIRGVYLNGVWAHAAETMTFELVGTSTGEPGLTLQLARPPVLQGTLELRVRELLGEEERADLLASDDTVVLSDVENLSGDWVRWRAVPDPGDCSALDRVYTLDEKTGTLTFGDGRHGMIPPVVPDGIVAFVYQRTEASAEGATTSTTPADRGAMPTNDALVPGNRVDARATLNLVSPVQGVEAVFAADQAAGGAAPDSVERVLRLAPARLRDRGRALTLRDLEDVALDSSSDIAQARAFRTAAGVRIVAVVRGADPRPTLAAIRELRSDLEAATLPALASGSALSVEPPVVRGIRVELVAAVATLDVAGDVARYVKQKLRAFFDTAAGGVDQRGWKLGAQPDETDIALALLDAPDLASLEKISFVAVEDDGEPSPWRSPVRSNEIVVLATDGVRIDFHVLDTVS